MRLWVDGADFGCRSCSPVRDSCPIGPGPSGSPAAIAEAAPQTAADATAAEAAAAGQTAVRERQQQEEERQQQQLRRARERQQQEWREAVRHRPEEGWAAGAGDAAPAEGAAQPAAELAAELAAAAGITPSQAAAAAAGASVVAGPATESHPSEAAVPRALSEAGGGSGNPRRDDARLFSHSYGVYKKTSFSRRNKPSSPYTYRSVVE